VWSVSIDHSGILEEIVFPVMRCSNASTLAKEAVPGVRIRPESRVEKERSNSFIHLNNSVKAYSAINSSGG
jgi:hypothetical protein